MILITCMRRPSDITIRMYLSVRSSIHRQGRKTPTLTLDFGRSFARGFSLSVAYRRINQVGEFDHQRQKDTGFSVGIWHDAPSGKYDAFYNYLNNAAVTQENGGVSEPDSNWKSLISRMKLFLYI